MPALNYLFFVILLSTIISCSTETNCPGEGAEFSEYSIVLDGKYDSTLAERIQADEYGMHQYVMAFLKKGPNRSTDSAKAAALQRAHLDNINRLAEEGKLVMAGPFMDDTEIRGIYVFDVTTIEEAKALTETDPAIQSGSLIMELHPWYGSAALMLSSDLYNKVAKQQP